jgi:hypothetical protein
MSLIMVFSCSKTFPKADDPGLRIEAVAWLTSNENPYSFASNRFSSTDEAILFVEKLYARGAVQVLVTGIYDEAWRIEAEGGPYADTLIIILPEEKGARLDLFEIANDEAKREGFASEKDTGQEELMLWWD